MLFFFSSRRRHTRCSLVTGVQTCALPISRVRLVEVDNDSFVIDTPREAEQTERRAFYRLPVRIVPRFVARLDDAGNEVQAVQAVILDLSGGIGRASGREGVCKSV